MARKKGYIKKEENINFRSTHDLRERYFAFCKKNNFIFSKRLRALMEKDLRGEIR